jgi:hypothetical protein
MTQLGSIGHAFANLGMGRTVWAFRMIFTRARGLLAVYLPYHGHFCSFTIIHVRSCVRERIRYERQTLDFTSSAEATGRQMRVEGS